MWLGGVLPTVELVWLSAKYSLEFVQNQNKSGQDNESPTPTQVFPEVDYVNFVKGVIHNSEIVGPLPKLTMLTIMSLISGGRRY